jgi:S1-C subfamily serine protease
MKKSKIVIGLIVVAIMVAVLPGCSAGSGAPASSTPINSAGTTSLYDEGAIVSLYEKSIPAVVEVYVTTSIGEQQGSGFVIDDQGHILTNFHVVEGATDVSVVLHDGRTLAATVSGTDRESDLALLTVDPGRLSGITPLSLGDSDGLKPGQMAIALGSPFQLEGSISLGIISGVGRSLTGLSQRSIPDTLQTDAAINPGNSGGPLLNSKGEVIGINYAIEASSTGIGFAIPVNIVKALLPDLLKGGEVQTAWLGITAIAIDEDLVQGLSLPVNSGIYVLDVAADSPAARVGIKGGGLDPLGLPQTGGDIVTAIDGSKVTKVEDVISYLNSKRPGDQVSLSVQRGDQGLTIEVTLGQWPDTLS